MKNNQRLPKSSRLHRKVIFSVVVIGIVTSIGCIIYPPGKMPMVPALIVSMSMISVLSIWIMLDMPDHEG